MNIEKSINVGLVDDHQLLRNALASLIDRSGCCQVVIQSNNGKEFINDLRNDNHPDVLLLDMNMPEMDGYDTAVWLKKYHPEIKILMLTMYDSEISMIRLLQIGIKGFLKKDIHPNEMIKAILSVMSDDFYYTPQTSNKLAGLFRESNDRNTLLQKVMLDNTEIYFLKLVCTEMTYKEIAIEMKLNPRSIDTIRDSLFTRLDVKSRVGLAMYAMRHGIVNP
jgi:two-component system invasion response regulator UvrY